MKKWFITFCALGLISTQAQAADAASIQEEGQKGFVKQEVKVIQMDQYEDLLANFKNDISFTNIHSFKELSNKLMGSTVQLEKLIAAQLKECNNNNSTGMPIAVAPSENESTNENAVQEEDIQTPETAAPENNKEVEEEAAAPKAPVAEQPAPAPAAPSAPTEKAEEATQPATPAAEADSVSAFETQVVELTNAERAKNGLAPLEIYNPLMKVAHAKSQDMASNNYFSHTSPTYGSPFDQIKAAGITYSAAGENIAQGQRTPEEVVQAWMNSEGHRANILNANFTHIGVGYVENGNYWTQQFIQL